MIIQKFRQGIILGVQITLLNHFPKKGLSTIEINFFIKFPHIFPWTCQHFQNQTENRDLHIISCLVYCRKIIFNSMIKLSKIDHKKTSKIMLLLTLARKKVTHSKKHNISYKFFCYAQKRKKNIFFGWISGVFMLCFFFQYNSCDLFCINFCFIILCSLLLFLLIKT